MKLWEKKTTRTEAAVEQFTVGLDRELDRLLAPYDVQGSLAHAEMLYRQGLLDETEWLQLKAGLEQIATEIAEDKFRIEAGVEDVHSQVELLLTERLGDVGKKLHTGRSRNDQVALDIKLYLRAEVLDLRDQVQALVETLLTLSEQYRHTFLPGYTHFQVAMPTSFGLWYGCYAESLVEDLELLAVAYHICNRNPLGSGAGFGSSFPLDRDLTTRLLGMERPNINAMYAQMSRGKTEKIVATAAAGIAGSIGRMAMDICLYLSQNFAFLQLPPELSTGSSIMPHKQNPDVFELVRGRCSRWQSVAQELGFLQHNLPAGYHRDLQLTKEILFPALASLHDCLNMMQQYMPRLIPQNDLLEDPQYRYIFSVEAINILVKTGVPFRDAYRRVGDSLQDPAWAPVAEVRQLEHTHLGSVGNPGTERIRAALQQALTAFNTSGDQGE
jgi:argininosuccinate lyase